jgi:hypothetical protein
VGFVLAIVVVIITFLALVHAIAFSDTLNLICLLLLAVAIILGGAGPVWGWIERHR